MLLEHNLKPPQNENISYPLHLQKTHNINYLSLFWVHEDILVLQINNSYSVYESKQNQKLWEWEVALEPSRLFFLDELIIAEEEGRTILYKKKTGEFISELKLNSSLDFINEEAGLIVFKRDEQKFIAKIALHDLVYNNKTTTLWELPIENVVFGHHLFQDNKLILNIQKKNLFCLDWQTGQKLWEANGDDYFKEAGINIFNAYQALSKDSVFSAYGHIVSLDINTGEKKWQNSSQMGVYGTSVDSLNRLYFITHTKYLVMDAITGGVIFEKPMQEILKDFGMPNSNFAAAKPMVTDQHIIFSNSISHLLFVNKFTGNVEWSHHFEGAKQVGHPLKVENGRLFLVVDHQLVVMEEVKKPIY